MFDIASSELLLVAVVALVVIGPKDLPRVMRVVGHWVGKARGMARHFRAGMDEMIRQSELDELNRKWTEQNERIMREHPMTDEYRDDRVDDGPAMTPKPVLMGGAPQADPPAPAAPAAPPPRGEG